MASGAIVIHKVWRSEVTRIGILLLLCVAAVILSQWFPHSVIQGEVISWGDKRLDLNLPLFALMPVIALGDLIARIYDVRYTLDAEGIEARIGIISLSQRIIRLRYEDVRLVEFDQSLMERALDIGEVQIGTAASAEVEMRMYGVSSPREIQKMIQGERDKRRLTDPETEKNLERAQA